MMKRHRILMVDDESGFTHLVKLTLERTGRYSVREENDARHALASAQEFKPDLIVLDVVMPELDGGDVKSQIRADPLLQSTPVIFLSAIVSKDEAAQEKRLDGLPTLAKPVSIKKLMDCIDANLPARLPAGAAVALARR